MALNLPDYANAGDTGHIADTNLIIDALATLDGQAASPRFRSGQWSTSALLTLTPGGQAFVTGNRTYYTEFPTGSPLTITAIAFYLTTAGDPTALFRVGLYADNAGTPGTLIEQTTFPVTSVGDKTWTLTTPWAVTGRRFWVAGCPQGTGTLGGTWMSNTASAGSGPTVEASAVWAHNSYNTACLYTDGWSGAFVNNPAITYDQSNNRNMTFFVRAQ